MMNNKPGRLFVFSAPSGAGKTTICKEIERRMDRFRHSVSYTTRKIREGEIDGRDYFFVAERTFDDMIENGLFIEWETVHGNKYGTSREFVENLLGDGYNVVFDVDTKGAMALMKEFGERGAFIFVLPPDFAKLKERLEKRGTDSEETILERLNNSIVELMDAVHFDYFIVNDSVENSLLQFKKITEDGTKNIDIAKPLIDKIIEEAKTFLNRRQ